MATWATITRCGPWTRDSTNHWSFHGGGIGQPSDPPGGEGKYTDPVLFHNGRRVETKGYCTDVYFNNAMEFIEKNAKAHRNFFTYIPTNAPHVPLNDVPEDLYKKFKQMDLRPLVVEKLPPNKMAEETDRLARILAMVANIDDNIGRLTDRLEKLGILNNTLVIFLTDNGPNTMRFVGPLRGMKAYVTQGGVRTAFFAQWPARIKPGTKCDTVAAHIDVLPTILEACGVAPPTGLKLDGRSILPLLLGDKAAWPDRTLFLQSHRGDVPVLYHHFTAIDWPFALVNSSGFNRVKPAGKPSFELYNLQDDPGERTNLAGGHPEIVDRLRQAYEAWFKDVSSTRADNYAPPRIVIGTPQRESDDAHSPGLASVGQQPGLRRSGRLAAEGSQGGQVRHSSAVATQQSGRHGPHEDPGRRPVGRAGRRRERVRLRIGGVAAGKRGSEYHPHLRAIDGRPLAGGRRRPLTAAGKVRLVRACPLACGSPSCLILLILVSTYDVTCDAVLSAQRRGGIAR